MRDAAKVLIVALLAGGLGVAASLAGSGPGPLLHSALGQRLVAAWMRTSAPTAPAGVAIAAPGEPVPAMKLTDLSGNIVELPRAFAGRPLVVNVWASWCGPCVAEMPELQRFAARQPANGMQVLGIALDDRAAVRDFLRRIRVDYPILLDVPGPADAGVRLGNPKGVLPYSVLLSADGRLRRQHFGPFAPGELDSWARD